MTFRDSLDRYRDRSPNREPTRETSILTLSFRRQDGRWVMVVDQNTPVRCAG